MSEKTRNLLPGQTVSRVPQTSQAWGVLMNAVIRRLTQLGRPTAAMQDAYANGRSEQTLRRMGIICQTDIDREFPLR